ncbi:uncharacterized protein TNCV_3236171 [Trichonephila clavipes]|nr:uncharacterized protein TNCV_3236171 [Trichonephila clavipes]
MDEEANFPIAASVLRNNLYMDDVLCGAATLEEAIVLRQQFKGILKSAGMELHKLCAHHEKLSPEVIEIHGFADASERCYGAAVYCKSKNLKSETLVRLITSKSRIAPIKSLTIPRLELCAAVLLAKLVKRVVAALQLETAELYLWSDSMIVLAWLRKEPMDLKTFVQNRVAKIQELYPNQLWRHVPSDQNPADLVSRGVDPDKLLQQNLWFNGPTFLSGDDDYPNRFINCREKLYEYNSELKNCVNEQIENFQSVLNIHVNDFLNDLLNLSNNYITILRVLSFIFRFVEKLKRINKVAGPLTTKEFEKAETFLVKKVQEQEFSSDINHLKIKLYHHNGNKHLAAVHEYRRLRHLRTLNRSPCNRKKNILLQTDLSTTQGSVQGSYVGYTANAGYANDEGGVKERMLRRRCWKAILLLVQGPLHAVYFVAGGWRGSCAGHLTVGEIKGGQRLTSFRASVPGCPVCATFPRENA